MPRLMNIKERQHQPMWDVLLRTYGATDPSLQTRTSLFGSTNLGSLARTNMTVAGQLASDQTYVILAMRCYMYFDGTNRRAAYNQTSSQLYFTLTLSEKPQFQCPAWYLPQGGGVWGFDSGTSIFTNGVPDQNSILKLAKPIVVPVRQNIVVIAEFFQLGSLSAITILSTSRDSSDQSVIMFMIDGIRTRDVL